MLVRRILPLAQRIAFGPHIHRVPGVGGVVHVEVIMVASHRHNETSAVVLEEFYEGFGVPLLGLEQRN